MHGSRTVLAVTPVERQLTLRYRTKSLQRGSRQFRAKSCRKLTRRQRLQLSPAAEAAHHSGRVGPLLVARHLGRRGVDPSRQVGHWTFGCGGTRGSLERSPAGQTVGRLITGWMSILDHSRKTVLRELAGQPPTELTKALEMEGGRNRYSLGLNQTTDKFVRIAVPPDGRATGHTESV